jgi:hypothetical protein
MYYFHPESLKSSLEKSKYSIGIISLIANSERKPITPLCPPGLESSPHIPHHPMPIYRHCSPSIPPPSPLHHLPLPPTQKRRLLLLSSQPPPPLRPKSRRPSGLSSPLLFRTHLLPHLVSHLHPNSPHKTWCGVVWLGPVLVCLEDCLSALGGWW